MPFVQDNTSTVRGFLKGAVTGVGAGEDAVITIPIGAAYEQVQIKCTISGVAATRLELEAFITQIQIQLSQLTLATYTGTQWIAKEEFFNVGIVGDSGYLTVSWSRDFMRQLAAARLPAIGTVDETAFTIVLTQHASSTIDKMRVMYAIRPGQEELGEYIRYERYSPGLPAAGTFVDYNIIKPKVGEFLYWFAIQVSTAADLTSISLIADESTRILDTLSQADLLQIYKNPIAPRTQQTAKKIIFVDLCAVGWNDPVPLTMKSLAIQVYFANAPTVFNVLAGIGAKQPARIKG